MVSDLAPATSEQESANSNPVGSLDDMGRSRHASKQPFNDNLGSLSSQTCSQPTMEPQHGILLKLSTIKSRDSLGDPPEVFENPESSSPGRSVRSLRSMHSVSPPGRGPIFPSEFDYLTKKPSKQSSVDADPIKVTISTPKGRSQTSISNELDQGQSSRDHATRVNINLDDIESKQSWKSSSPPGEHLQKYTPFVRYCTSSHIICFVGFVLSMVDSDDVVEDQVNVPHPKEDYSLPEALFGGDAESDSDLEDALSFRADLKLGNLRADAEIQIRDETSEMGNRDSSERRAGKNKDKSHCGIANSVSTKDVSLRSDKSRSTEPTVSSSVDSSSKSKLDKGHSKLNTGIESNEDHSEPANTEEIPRNDESMIPDSLFGSLTAPSSESKPISLKVDTGRNQNPPSTTSRKATKTPDATAKKDSEEKSQQSRHTSKSETSRWWKKKKGGMKMANVIKQAFTKSKQARTPSKQTEECPFSNEEDDIFCGLEDDVITNLMAEVDEKNRGDDTPASKPLKLRTQPSESPQSEKAQFPVAATPESMTAYEYSNDRTDRSGTVLHQSEIEPVNSDMTSSILAGGGPSTRPAPSKSNAPEADSSKETKSSTEDKPDDKPDDKVLATAENSPGDPATPDSAMTKSVSTRKSSTRAKSPKTSKIHVPKTSKINAKSSRPPKPPTKKDGDKAEAKEDPDDGSVDNSILSSSAPPPSLFMKFGCGIVDSFTTGVTTSVCRSDIFGTAKQPSSNPAYGVGTDKSDVSGTGSANNASQLTNLEQRVWTDWDRRDTSLAKDENTDANSAETSMKKEANDKKREAARDKLLGYGTSAITTQTSLSKGLFAGSSEYSDDSSSSSFSESEFDATTRDSKSYYSTGTEMFSEMGSTDDSLSEDQSPHAVDVKTKLSVTTTPILLSFSQRSLVEKFTKQLGTDGVEVLKLNSRKQWQVRYFTVSKEQIALTAHEAKSRSGDTAQCPKALLWLKKFNNKNGGYGLTNIDKSGHGGMMIVELTDVSVSNKQDIENPLPKKLQSKFEKSVLVTLDYTMNGGFRSVTFRCKDNDEAQFLCTCLRVIRDLVKREQYLRLR